MAGGFEELDAWKLAHALALDLYRVIERFPPRERYGLTLQIRRAALSIPANLAEGSARQSPKEFFQFCSVARGSIAEVRYFLRFSRDIGWVDQETHQHIVERYERVSKMTNALMSYLRTHPRPTRQRE